MFKQLEARQDVRVQLDSTVTGDLEFAAVLEKYERKLLNMPPGTRAIESSIFGSSS
jgi:hypothetical protein